jgi:hypothetical protein
MQKNSSENVKVAKCLQDRLTSQHNLICIPLAWPFSCWGLDQVEPLKKAKGGFEYIFVAIDKFTKWIKYKLLIKYSAAKVVKFI